MSHVDEGQLHAYLDGAFAPDDAHCAEIAAHLASCTDCRGRLEDARALKDRARDVLRHSTPVDVQVPPFETLRARKLNASEGGASAPAAAAAAAAEESVPVCRLARSTVRLAWAASIGLALGAGWMANELIQRSARNQTAAQDAARRVSLPTADARDARAAAPEAMAGPQARPSREGRAGVAAVAPSPAQVDSSPPPAAVPMTPPGASDLGVVPLARAAQRLADRDAALDRTLSARADARAFAGHFALLSDYATAGGNGLWSPATPGQAAAALGRQPAGIADLRHAETETAVVDGRVLVRQRYMLDGGAQLELIQRPAPPRAETAVLRDPGTVIPPAGVPFKDLGVSSPSLRGESIVAASRPGLILLLKGTVRQDSLHAIAARLLDF